jgi:hypothetical protein
VQLRACCDALEAARLGAFGEKLTPRDAEATIGEIDNSRDQRSLASERGLRHERRV